MGADDIAEDRLAHVRASDAEREQALAELRNGFAEGRITHETLAHRIDAALRARLSGDLHNVVADLPKPQRPSRLSRPGLLGGPGTPARPGMAARPGTARLGADTPLGTAAARLGASARLTGRRAVRAVDRWLRGWPPSLTLPAGAQYRFTIGREPACDMTLADDTVSRWHASLERSAAGWLLADLGSTNGTRLNGWRVNHPTVVRPGDMVSFGGVTFVLSDRVR
ncbi:MAG TPA: DUF1707 and FHA domain-containing protein [Streptosporangiaceae bacterium]|nr:DUF1707 and FHA domain-containing protein [Streptosporangiaceae bacterium]